MATILAAATGNWTDPATWIGGIVPGESDVAVSNNKTVTIDQSVTCAEVRNDTTGGATAGGYFRPLDAIVLTADVYGGTTSNCVGLSASTSATIIGDITGGTGAGGSCYGVYLSNATLTHIGNAYGGTNHVFNSAITPTGSTSRYILIGNAIASDTSYAVGLGNPALAYIYGTVRGNNYGPGSTGIANGVAGCSNGVGGTLYVQATQVGERGMAAIRGKFSFIDTAHATEKALATSGLIEVTLRHPDAVCPHPADVEAGTSYSGGTLTGYAVEISPILDMRNP